MSLPTLSGTGRLTADPELRFAPSGTAVCKVNVAFNSRRKNAQGEWEDADVLFVGGTLFKEAAENAAETLGKGDEVIVSGRLKTRQWETPDGEKRSTVELLIDSIGPSLRYAQAKVQKMGRSSQGGTAAAADDPWASATPAQPAAASASEPPF